MPSSLRNRLNELAASFSAGVLDAIRGASLEELLSESSGGKSRAPSRAPGRRGAPAAPAPPAAAPATRRRPGRLPRRSAGDISQGRRARSSACCQSIPRGFAPSRFARSSDCRRRSCLVRSRKGSTGGRLSKVGRKRATTYFAGAGSRVRARWRARRRRSRPGAGAREAGERAAKAKEARRPARAPARSVARGKAGTSAEPASARRVLVSEAPLACRRDAW